MKRENYERVKKIMKEVEDVEDVLRGFKLEDLGITVSPSHSNIKGIWVNNWRGLQESDSIEEIASRFLYDYWNFHVKLKDKLIKELETL